MLDRNARRFIVRPTEHPMTAHLYTINEFKHTEKKKSQKLQTNRNCEDVVTAKVVVVKQTGTKHKASGQLSLTSEYTKKMKYIDIRMTVECMGLWCSG